MPSTLGKLFFDLAPSYQVTFADAETPEERIRRFVDCVLHPDDKDASTGLIEIPDEWQFPEDFDSWPANRREEHLRETLREPANSRRGYKLNELSSRVIEDYLGRRKS